MSETYWEPWAPTVNQRVRIKLSGECEHGGGLPYVSLHNLYGVVFHVLAPGEPAMYRLPDGSDPQPLDVRGHRFGVVPEHPMNTMGAFAWLAAMELEPA